MKSTKDSLLEDIKAEFAEVSAAMPAPKATKLAIINYSFL